MFTAIATHTTSPRPVNQVGLATLVTVLLLAGAFGGIVWRYEHAQAEARAALTERADRQKAEEAVAIFWHQREAINEYLITRRPDVLREIAGLKRRFFSTTLGLAHSSRAGRESDERELMARARAKDRRLFAEFDHRRAPMRGQQGPAAIEALHPFELAVLQPLRDLNRLDLEKERAGIHAAAAASGQARVVAIFGGLLALAAGLAFAAYVAGLLRHVRRQADVLAQTLEEREQTHAALQERESQLRQSQKMEAVGRLAGGVAHDFNNMLLAITGYGELALTEVEPEQLRVRHALEQINLASGRAAGLTAQLLAFSRQQILQTQAVDLNPLIEGLTGMLRPLLGETVDLRLELTETAGTVEADPGQLEQVITNLVVNARDAMPNGGRVTIATADADPSDLPLGLARGSYVAVKVVDTGSGMDEDTLAHALEPFFTTKEQGKGTGLGLATVHGIVTQTGGDIRIVTALGRGTSIEVYLPSTNAIAGADGDVDHPVAVAGNETVLLVEDDSVVQALLVDVLASHGYNVIAASDGGEAIEEAVARGTCGDLVVTDMVMPGMSGRELIDRLRMMHPDVRALYMSGYTQDAELYEDAETGRVDFLQKPFSPATLLQGVRDALGRPVGADADSFDSSRR